MVVDNDARRHHHVHCDRSAVRLLSVLSPDLLGPDAYYVQEMTVRLGALTKRGHAEAIFHSFGAFWGWFSLLDLELVDWLTNDDRRIRGNDGRR